MQSGKSSAAASKLNIGGRFVREFLLHSAVMDDIEGIRKKLVELRTEHRDLDDIIDRLTQDSGFNQVQVQRLKKRKLSIKDQISNLENQILPDIIA